MKKKAALAWKLELLWWLFTIAVALGILYPITNQIYNYPFLVINIIFIIVFVTFTRYIFLLNYTFLAHRRKLKMVLIILCLPLIFSLVAELNNFQAFVGEEGLDSFMNHLPLPQQQSMVTYIRNEMLLFGTGSVITAILFPLRMMMSVWRNLNRGTV